jgi:histidinol-phosphate aminotransferase
MIFHNDIYGLEAQPRTEDFSLKRLHLNENPFDYPKELAEIIKKEIDFSIAPFYADTFSKRLGKVLSEYTGVPQKYIQIGNGGDDIIYTLLGGVCHRGDKVLTLEPSYYYYDVAIKSHGLEREKVHLDDNLEFSLMEFIDKACQKEIKLVFLCNPNNPTGHLIEDSLVERIIESIPDDKLIVLDEAYFEFSKKSFYTKVLDKKNLLILRTMSKMYSFAGVHVGYILGHPDLIRDYERFKNPYSVNFLTQTAAAVTLENRHFFNENLKKIEKIRSDFTSKVEEHSFTAYPSYTNFVLIRPKSRDEKLTQRLLSILETKKIQTRPLSGNFSDALRISISTAENMEEIINCLKLL